MDGARRPLCMLRGISSCHPPRTPGLRHFRTAGWGALDYDEAGFMLQPRYKDVRGAWLDSTMPSTTRFVTACDELDEDLNFRWRYRASRRDTPNHLVGDSWPSFLQWECEGARSLRRPKRVARKRVSGYLTNVNKYVSVSRYILKRHIYDEETDFYVTFISQSRLQSVTGFYDVERFGSTYTRQFKLLCYAARCTAK